MVETELGGVRCYFLTLFTLGVKTPAQLTLEGNRRGRRWGTRLGRIITDLHHLQLLWHEVKVMLAIGYQPGDAPAPARQLFIVKGGALCVLVVHAIKVPLLGQVLTKLIPEYESTEGVVAADVTRGLCYCLI